MLRDVFLVRIGRLVDLRTFLCGPCLELSIAVTPLVPQSSSQSLLEDIDPFAKTGKVIEAMEASLSSLIDESGDTLDEQTLLALQRATAGVQSAKLAEVQTVFSYWIELNG